MRLNYPKIIAEAISDGKDPVHTMNKWYRVTRMYGGKPQPPPTLTFDQINSLRQYAAESNCTMSDLFYAVLQALRAAEGTDKGAAEGTGAPTKPTVNVYTKDQVIHHVPVEKLSEMGPATLASIVTITDEIPWDERRVVNFKKQQAAVIADKEAKKKAALEHDLKRALDETEDLEKAAKQPYVRRIQVYDPGALRYVTTLDKVWSLDEAYWFTTVQELVGDAWYDWPTNKVMALNQKRAAKAAESKKAARKAQIDELVSKLIKERNEL